MRINNRGTNYQINKNLSQKPGAQESEKPEASINAKDLLDSNALNSLLANNIKPGEKLTISSGNDDLLTIRKERGPSRMRELGRAFAIEAGGIVKYDKGLAFKLGAIAVKETDLIGVASTISKSVDNAFLPMLRVVGGMLDAHNMMKTLKDPKSNIVDKTIDIAHVATDVAGIAGAVMSYCGIAPGLSTALTISGVMGDVAAHGYHIVRYFEEKGDSFTLGNNTQTQTQETPVPQVKEDKKIVVPEPQL